MSSLLSFSFDCTSPCVARLTAGKSLCIVNTQKWYPNVYISVEVRLIGLMLDRLIVHCICIHKQVKCYCLFQNKTVFICYVILINIIIWNNQGSLGKMGFWCRVVGSDLHEMPYNTSSYGLIYSKLQRMSWRTSVYAYNYLCNKRGGIS